MKTLYRIFIISLFPIYLMGQNKVSLSNDYNYIHTRSYTANDGSKYLDVVNYFDGMGRLVETVQPGITPAGATLASYIECDIYGRPVHTYLPAVISSNNGTFVSPSAVVKAAESSHQGDNHPYSRTIYEMSNLNRPIMEYGPGKDWHPASYLGEGKGIKIEYVGNAGISGELSCAKFVTEGSKSSLKLSRDGYYSNGALSGTKMRNEDGNTIIELKDESGNIVLSRQINTDDPLAGSNVVTSGNLVTNTSLTLSFRNPQTISNEQYIYFNLVESVKNKIGVIRYHISFDVDLTASDKKPFSVLALGDIYYLGNGDRWKYIIPHEAFSIKQEASRSYYSYTIDISHANNNWGKSQGQAFIAAEAATDVVIGKTLKNFTIKSEEVTTTTGKSTGRFYDTYYVYDNWGNLAYVLPPLAVEKVTTYSDDNAEMKKYAYIYKYDTHNRCISKKLPGADPVYYVYDKADRLIFSQDGEQRVKGEWTFSIPDAFGRIVLAGTCKNSLNYANNPLGNNLVKAERANGTNTYKGYATPTGVTLTSPTILTVNYYDDYAFLGYNNIPKDTHTNYNAETGYGTQYTTSAKDLLTGTLTAQMKTDGTVDSNYLYSVMYYDDRGRLVQTKSNNHMTGGLEKEYIAYDFVGNPTQKKHVHSATGKTTQTEVYKYTYDHAGRLMKTTHKLNTGTEIILAENTYDEQGRLKTNKKGNQNSLNTTYSYNIRSWITGMNSYNLLYNITYTYSGNINTQKWRMGGIDRQYSFTYDQLSRLKGATYTGASNEKYGVAYSYDKHGNINTIQRSGKTTATAYGLIDNLTLTYTGNQLTKAEDASATVNLAESGDFKNYSNIATEYTYNKNGAMTKDLNKGISSIAYNSLNLPRQMDIKSPVAEARNEYTYSAGGMKMKVVQKSNPNYSTAPTIGSTISTAALTNTHTTDYVGNMIYENGTLKRVLVDGGYYDTAGKKYIFFLTDHLGNNRLLIDQAVAAVQRNHYYPFGMSFAETPKAEQEKQQYKYNGKELDQLHGLNLYDYSARHYDPAIGRFTTMDPLAEKFYSWSPYTYAKNNPIKYIDPDGRFPIVPIIIFVGLLLNSDVAVAPTKNPSKDAVAIKEARDSYNMNNLGLLAPVAGGQGAGVVSKTLTTEAGKKVAGQIEKQVAKETANSVKEQIKKDFNGGNDTNSKTSREAFRNAKDQNGIPRSQQPKNTTTVPDKNTGKPLKQYEFTNSKGEKVVIRKDNPVTYPDGGKQGPHYNAGKPKIETDKLNQHHNYEN